MDTKDSHNPRPHLCDCKHARDVKKTQFLCLDARMLALGTVPVLSVPLTKAQVRLAQAAMGKKETRVSDLCEELGVTRVTLYRYVGPEGELREHGRRALTR